MRAPIAGLLALLCLAAPSAVSGQDGDVVPSSRSVLLERADRARIRGDSAAPIRIVEVSDFERPF